MQRLRRLFLTPALLDKLSSRHGKLLSGQVQFRQAQADIGEGAGIPLLVQERQNRQSAISQSVAVQKSVVSGTTTEKDGQLPPFHLATHGVVPA